MKIFSHSFHAGEGRVKSPFLKSNLGYCIIIYIFFMLVPTNISIEKNKAGTACRCYFLYGIGWPLRARTAFNLRRATCRHFAFIANPYVVGCPCHIHRARAKQHDACNRRLLQMG